MPQTTPATVVLVAGRDQNVDSLGVAEDRVEKLRLKQLVDDILNTIFLHVFPSPDGLIELWDPLTASPLGDMKT